MVRPTASRNKRGAKANDLRRSMIDIMMGTRNDGDQGIEKTYRLRLRRPEWHRGIGLMALPCAIIDDGLDSNRALCGSRRFRRRSSTRPRLAAPGNRIGGP